MSASPHAAITVPGEGRARLALAWEDFRVALRGERHGVPIEIVYLKETWTETGSTSC